MSRSAFLRRSMALVAIVGFMAMYASESLADTKTEVYATRGDRELTITLHYPQDWSAGDARPSIIFFFGGGWNAGERTGYL